MSSDPTHFTVILPLTEDQGEEAKALLETFNDWVSARVSEEEWSGTASPEDLAFFERIYSSEFEDWTGIEVTFKRGNIMLEDEAGEPSMQLAGDFLSALMDRFDIDGTLDLVWTGSSSGKAVVSRESIAWPDELQVTKPAVPQP